MLSPLPVTEIALRETLISRAPKDALQWLSRFYQLPFPTIVETESWRDALRAVLYGARGTRGNMHAFLERMMQQWNETFRVSVGPTNPQRLTWVSGGTVNGFESRHVNRLIRIGERLYYSVATDGNAVSAYLDLCPVGTAQWDAASFKVNQSLSADVLPFIWTDTGAQFFLWADTQTACPPTYLQPAVMWGGLSLGGLAGQDTYPLGSDTADNPAWAEPVNQFYVYPVTEETAGTWRYLIANADNGLTPARGGTYTLQLMKTAAGGLVPANTALTCTIGANAETGADLTHTATFAVGDLAILKVTAGAGVNKPLTYFHASVYIDPPAGMPKGGYVLENTWVNGDQTLGPWPIYIGTELDYEMVTVIEKLLAAGVVLRPKIADFNVVNGLP